jgi:hypothetical protein
LCRQRHDISVEQLCFQQLQINGRALLIAVQVTGMTGRSLVLSSSDGLSFHCS